MCTFLHGYYFCASQSNTLAQGSPVAGYLLAAFGGVSGGLEAYHPAMFYGGSLALISAILLAIVRFRINKKFLAVVHMSISRRTGAVICGIKLNRQRTALGNTDSPIIHWRWHEAHGLLTLDELLNTGTLKNIYSSM